MGSQLAGRSFWRRRQPKPEPAHPVQVWRAAAYETKSVERDNTLLGCVGGSTIDRVDDFILFLSPLIENLDLSSSIVLHACIEAVQAQLPVVQTRAIR